MTKTSKYTAQKLSIAQIEAMEAAAQRLGWSAYEFRQNAIAHMVRIAGVEWPEDLRGRGRPPIEESDI